MSVFEIRVAGIRRRREVRRLPAAAYPALAAFAVLGLVRLGVQGVRIAR